MSSSIPIATGPVSHPESRPTTRPQVLNAIAIHGPDVTVGELVALDRLSDLPRAARVVLGG